MEQTAIEACQRGELGAFAQLYDGYIKKIYAFIYVRIMHREIAEDLTSEVFMRALEKIRTYQPEKGSFSSWLYRIARNAVIDYYRTRKGDSDIDDMWGATSEDDVEKNVALRADFEMIEQALRTFESRQREILYMRLWQGLSHKEIAETLSLSEANVKMTYSRTIRRLRDMVGSSIVTSFILSILLWQR